MKTIKMFSMLMTSVLLLSGCSANTATPSPTVAAPSPTAAEPAQTQPPGSTDFGRYAAARPDALYYVSDNAIWLYQGGAAAKLCDVPNGQTAEDIYAPEGDAVFFSALSVTPDDQGNNRVIYRVSLAEQGAQPTEFTRSFGPMVCKDGTLHVIQSGEIICINSSDGAQISCSNPGTMAQLMNAGTSDSVLYYGVFTEEGDGGIPFGDAKLVRLNLKNLDSDLIGDMYKANSKETLTVDANLVCQRKPSGTDDSVYLLSILDSKEGAADTQYPVPKTILDGQLGAEMLYLAGENVYMLVMSQDGSASEMLTCYQLKADAPVEIWKASLNLPITSICYDDTSGQIVVLCEGDTDTTFNLFTLSPANGAQTQAFAGNFGTTEAQHRLVDVGGTVLVFSLSGEDIPSATLLYAAALDNIAAPFVTGSMAAANEE